MRWLIVLLLMGFGSAAAETLPTGMDITPTAARGAIFQPLNPHLAALPDHLADSAVSAAMSPDGTALLVLTSGFNRVNGADGKQVAAASGEYVFVFDVSNGAPVQRQVLQVPNSFVGLSWAPDGSGFYVSGGVDDAVHKFRWQDHGFVADWTAKLGHIAGNGVKISPVASGVAASPDGHSVLVANYDNDSVTLLDAATGAVLAERDLRPGRIDPALAGQPGGTYPWWVVWTSPTRAYVSVQREREILALDVKGHDITVATRIAVRGQPNHLLASRDGTRLYAALDNSDSVAAIDTTTNKILADIPATSPAELLPNPEGLRGANPNFLALSPDEHVLFATLGGLNAIGVIRLDTDVLPDAAPAKKDDDDDDDDDDAPAATGHSRSIGLIPTGWYPNAVVVGQGGKYLYAVNGKSVPGPNPEGCRAASAGCAGHNEYVLQLEKAGFLAMPMPRPAELARLSRQVATNDHFPTVQSLARGDATMEALHQRIRHVIYVIKENRTYDQILGDLERGNGDPKLTLFPEPLGPNHHALARNFVTLDNFYDAGAVSPTGWNWSTSARATDMTEKTVPVSYARRGLSYDWEGQNRNINVGLPTLALRRAADPRVPDDADIVPGTQDVAAPDAAGAGEGQGYLWDLALRAGLSIRNYGFYGDFAMTDPDSATRAPLEHDPAAQGIAVFRPTKQALIPHTDPYYRGFDMLFPDFWRIREWQREFTAQDRAGEVPSLTLLRLPHDHLGDFGKAIDGVNTAETQFADNDYALGLLAETVAKSNVADSTLIFVLEDDAQNGPDHVDAHRSAGFVIGPYVRQQALVSTHYTTVSMLRTIEGVLGLPAMGLNDGLAAPMDDVFDLAQPRWTYRAIVPDILRQTQLPLPAKQASLNGPALCSEMWQRDSAYWQRVSAGQNFTVEDHLDVDAFNHALWKGRMGWWASYPDRSGADLTTGRAALLAKWKRAEGCL